MNVEKPNRFSSWQVLSAIALGTFVIEIGCAVDKDSTNTEPVYADEPEVRDALTGMLADAWPFAIDPSLTRAETAAASLKHEVAIAKLCQMTHNPRNHCDTLHAHRSDPC